MNNSNVCTNYLYISASEETVKYVCDFINNNFLCLDIDNQGDEAFIDFESKNKFPEDKMIKLYNSIKDKEEMYIRCLSVEYGNMYHALWAVYEDEGWLEY